jgi:hypothetical protein
MVVQILLSFNPVVEFRTPAFMLNNSLSRVGVFALMGQCRQGKRFAEHLTSCFA